MQHVHHRIDPGRVQRKAANQVVRQALEVVIGFLRLESNWNEGVQRLIRQRNRLVHAVHGAGRVQDEGGIARFLFHVGNRRGFMLFQQVFHQKPTVELGEQGRVRLADNLQPRNDKLSAHRAFQHDDVAQPQLLAIAQQALHQQRERPDLRDDQVGDSLPLDHAVDLLLVVKVEMVDLRYRGACHVQAVNGEDALRRRRADDRGARPVLSRDADACECLGIPLPVAEQLAIRVRPIAVPHGNAVQAFVAERVHLLDERPARLIQHVPAFELLHQLRLLTLFA